MSHRWWRCEREGCYACKRPDGRVNVRITLNLVLDSVAARALVGNPVAPLDEEPKAVTADMSTGAGAHSTGNCASGASGRE